MKNLFMKIASLVILIMLGQVLLAQEGEIVPVLSAVDSTLLTASDSVMLTAEDSVMFATEAIDVDSTEVPPLDSPESNPLISTEVSAEVPFQVAVPVVEEFQEPTMVKYTSDFQFGDGIYANFDMVLANDPIPPARIVTDLDMFDRGFYEKITAGKEIVIYDENGVKKELPTHEIWGYGRNGILYINVGSAFHRISFVGSICHFVATVTTYNPNYYDPYYYNPYYSSSYYYNRYSMPHSNVASTDLRQYLLDFETGDVMEYETESVEVLMMKDPELADEYHSLSGRKKKQMKFVFIRRYNERHPLYLPDN